MNRDLIRAIWRREPLVETERQRILEALDETRWVIQVQRAAAQLGVKRSTLQARILKLGITRNR
jgi:transcriptional regulator with GAF, ATPase, and Fis domain